MTPYLDDIKAKVEELASEIDAPEDLLPTYGYSRDGAYPHIEVHHPDSLHYVTIERGEELERKVTKDLDELLYWIFSDITASMAIDYELENRIEGVDTRRIAFARHQELLGKLSEEWKQRERKEYDKILREYPFDDLAEPREKYKWQLKQRGLPEEEINKLAYEKYPQK